MQAAEKGYSVAGLSRSYKPHFEHQNIVQVNALEKLVARLHKPRIVLMLVPAGPLSTISSTVLFLYYRKATCWQIVVTAIGEILSGELEERAIAVYTFLIAAQAEAGKASGL